MNAHRFNIAGMLALFGFSAASLGCAGLFASVNGATRSAEEEAWLQGFAKKYNDTAAASKKDFDSIEAYFNAIILAHDCSDSSHGQVEEPWPVETVDGQMTVDQAEKKCAKMMEDIRKKGTSEEGCGVASLSVSDGEQHAGTTEWTTSIQGRRNYDALERSGFGANHAGSRQLVACEKVPAKTNKPAPLWKKAHIDVAEDFCEKGSIIAYTGTDWNIENVSTSDGDRYLSRSLRGTCWYPKGRIGAEFSVPPICGKDDVAPGGHSCITAAGKLIIVK
jgi:hypothetical protein